MMATEGGFFALKGDVIAALAAVGVEAIVEGDVKTDPRFHPGRIGAVTVVRPQTGSVEVGHIVGRIAQIHPEIASSLGLPETTCVATFGVEDVLNERTDERRLKPVSRNPANPRDVALLIDRDVPYAEIERAVEEAGGDLLERQSLVEVYTGAGIPEGKHSLTLRLVFRKLGGNLTDEEANRARDEIVAALRTLGGTMR